MACGGCQAARLRAREALRRGSVSGVVAALQDGLNIAVDKLSDNTKPGQVLIPAEDVWYDSTGRESRQIIYLLRESGKPDRFVYYNHREYVPRGVITTLEVKNG